MKNLSHWIPFWGLTTNEVSRDLDWLLYIVCTVWSHYQDSCTWITVTSNFHFQFHSHTFSFSSLPFLFLFAFLGHSGSRSRQRGYLDEVALGLLMHFIFYIALILLANPENYRSTGPHQEIGDCGHVTYVNTILGQVSVVDKSMISIYSFSLWSNHDNFFEVSGDYIVKSEFQ